MTALHRVALIVLILEMPVPFYWLVVHGGIGFWRQRKRMRAAYLYAVLIAWGGIGGLLMHFRAHLFGVPLLGVSATPAWAVLTGLTLIVADAFLLTTVEIELGGHRLVGHAELTGRGEMTARGLYQWVRHPRYLGTILAVLGACLLGGSRALWVAAAFWLLAALAMIWLEDRELRVRFGQAYVAYAEHVPALLPLHRAPHGAGKN